MAHRPVLIVLRSEADFALSDLYMRVIDRAYTGAYMIARPPFRGDIVAFLNQHPKALIIYQLGDRSAVDQFAQVPSTSPIKSRLKVLSGMNSIAIDHVKDANEFMNISVKTLGVPFDPAILSEAKSALGTGFYSYQPLRNF